MMNDKEFVSLNIPEGGADTINSAEGFASRELSFLPSNYDYTSNTKSSDNSENNSTLNFGDAGKFGFLYEN